MVGSRNDSTEMTSRCTPASMSTLARMGENCARKPAGDRGGGSVVFGWPVALNAAMLAQPNAAPGS